MTRLAEIWRHPVKSHSRERISEVDLVAGQTMPWDRAWAVAHEAARTDGSHWTPCTDFSRGAKAPGLMGIDSSLDEAREEITLRHRDLPELTVSPDTESQALIDWARPLMPENRAASARLVRLAGRGMTDTDYPSISLANLASNRAVGEQLGQEISHLRWRANLWLDGLEAFAEVDFIGRRLRIGEAELAVREPIVRCMATTANPQGGVRDADTLGALQEGWGRQEFGVYAEVTRGGRLREGDAVEVLT